MTTYKQAKDRLLQQPKTWLVTGVAGFIGSHLLETLLKLNQRVVGLDNFATGHWHNLDDVKSQVGEGQWQNFRMIEGDICNLATCHNACADADIVLHQAALGSVPRSLEDPITTHEVNVSGFLNMLVAAREEGVSRFVYAASSSTYGDHEELPKREDRIGNPLSPYAVTKLADELYADVFARSYDYPCIGLRYFNVFGPRQDPAGAYAAVIPKWFKALLDGGDVFINGDGETSRDFCFVVNAVQANILAATTTNHYAQGQVYNVAFGEQTTLNQLFELIRENVSLQNPGLKTNGAKYRDFRSSDVRHSLADIAKANKLLNYQPEISLKHGLEIATAWYQQNSAACDAEQNR